MARDVALVVATGALTATANFSDNDTVLIGNITYKFEATPAAANDVDVGTDLETSLDNLTLAINNTGAAPGGEYFAGTAAVAGMIATNTATVLTLTARFGGTWGNSVHFAEGVDGAAAFSITTAMSSGAGDISGGSGFIAGIVNLSQLKAETIDDLNQLLETAL